MSSAVQVPTTLNPRERWENYSEVPLLVLGIAFLVAYATPIIEPGIPRTLQTAFEAVQVGTWVAFAIDYVVRLILAKPRLKFIRTHILDLAAVLLPMLRPLRALRVLSIVFLSAQRLSKVLKNRVITYVLITAIAVWFIAGLAVTDAERLAPGSNIHNVWEGWWWAFITMTTVGYGDFFPVTVEGRMVAVALVVAGVALIGTITAYIASWFAEARREAEAAIITEIDTAEDKIDVLTRQVRELRALVEKLAGPDPQQRD